MLKGKTAVIYGAGGSLGGVIARAFASAGARVFLTGRNAASMQVLAGEVIAAGGWAEIAEVDAQDEQSILTHLEKLERIDISFNATATEVVQGLPLMDMQADDYMNPVTMMLRTRFLTAKAAANRMAVQGSGVILSLTATPGGIGYPYTGGFAAACCAIENFAQNLASEIGIYGVRVVNIRSGGSPDSKVFMDAMQKAPSIMSTELGRMQADTMLKRMPLMADIANAAVFLASEQAGAITGVTIDVTAGTTAGLNYRVVK
jgi:3-oxoacyl-[acyl-carrier protein] reductase